MEEAREALERCENLREEQRASCKAFLSDFLLPPLDNMQQMVHEVRKNLDLYNSLRQEERKSEQEVSGTLEELADLHCGFTQRWRPLRRFIILICIMNLRRRKCCGACRETGRSLKITGRITVRC